MKRIKFKTALKVLIAGFVVLLVVTTFISGRIRWIPAGYVGVIYDANSGLQDRIIKPQATFVGWRQQVYVYPTMLRAAVYTQDPTAGEVAVADGIQITTNDNASTMFDVTVMYRVRPEDVIKVFNAFGAIPIEDIQTTQIRRATKEAANAVGTQYDLFSLMGPAREEASHKLTVELQRLLSPNGITIETAMLGACEPSQDIQSKITTRVNSYIELQISRLKRQIANIDSQVAVVKAEADSKARQLSASQTKDRSIDMLKLQAEEEAIERWNGQLPAISPKPGQTVIVSSDAIAGFQGGKRK